jgi:hypothetical protein
MIPSLSSTLGGAGEAERKRRFSNQRNGNAVPVVAEVHKKKNNQRGPRVGKVLIIIR